MQPEPLSGSEVPTLPADELVGPADPHDRLVVSVYLNLPQPAAAGPARRVPPRPPSPAG